MEIKIKIILVVIFSILLVWLSRVEVDVEESDLIGRYYTKPYGVVYDGQLNKFSDSLILTRDYKTIRTEYKNGEFLNEFSGSWKNWHIDGRYSIGIDIYGNDVLPRKRLLSGDVYFEIGHIKFHKTDI